MQASLCLIVRDEEKVLGDCLAPLRDLFDDVVVLDTGSTDGTRELLRERFGIVPLAGELEERLCYAKFAARNQVIEHARHPWILFVDADERLSREHAQALLDLPEDATLDGYFCRWDTTIAGVVVEDYKLPLFRRDARYTGLIHENPQQDLRRRGRRAAWVPGVTLLHHPDAGRLDDKRRFYRWRLRCALGHDDAWYRYHWFLGYALARHGDAAAAQPHLERAARSRAGDFPVECLNSHAVLAELHAARGERAAAAAVLESALEFYAACAADFEVRVNFRLKPWLEAALAACRAGVLDAVRTYDYSH